MKNNNIDRSTYISDYGLQVDPLFDKLDHATNEHTIISRILEMGQESLDPDNYAYLILVIDQLRTARRIKNE